MSNIKYFESQAFIFSKGEEISYPEALNRNWYVACYCTDNIPDYAEVIGYGKVKEVVYYNRQPLDENLLKKHISQYRNCPFEVVTPYQDIEGKLIRDIYFFNGVGELQAITEEHYNSQHDMIMEVRLDSNRNLSGRIQYEYDATGELKTVRELSPDGTVMSEEDYDN